jgi:glutathione S-transferase
MKLRFAATSPYVRKVVVAAAECGLEDRIERIDTNVWAPDTDIADDNPLGKVPTLITDDGRVLIDSPVICDYIDSLSPEVRLVPAEGDERWRVLNLAALGHGMMDASVGRVMEIRIRPEPHRWQGLLDRLKAKTDRALDSLEKEAAANRLPGVDLASITVGCALGYLDLRFAEEAWRNGRPALTAWYEAFSRRPSMQASDPTKLA